MGFGMKPNLRAQSLGNYHISCSITNGLQEVFGDAMLLNVLEARLLEENTLLLGMQL